MRFLLACILLVAPPARAGDAPDLRLIHLFDGFREGADSGGLEKSFIYKQARKAGIDLRAWHEPLLVHSFRNGRLFYVFYKTTENALGDRPYLIQRIRKTERTWANMGEAPTERVTYQVEVFKTLAGALKRADQHFGSFGLGKNARREIIKEYEIGFGEVPGKCAGTTWPYKPNTLFHKLQPYQDKPGDYPRVKFRRARKWKLRVAFDDKGRYAVESPELGFAAPERLPVKSRSNTNAASKKLVLEAAVGIGPFKLGEATASDLARLHGKPLEITRSGSGHANHSVRSGLTVNFDPDGKANTIITRTNFGGSTAKGVRLWDVRAAVEAAYGRSDRHRYGARFWRFEGIIFYFDGFDRVERIVITKVS